jgi:hypothetical protein
MKKNHNVSCIRLVILTAVLICVFHPSLNAAKPQGFDCGVVEYGIWNFETNAGTKVADTNTAAGYNIILPPGKAVLLAKTNRIPARLNVLFGMTCRLTGPKPGTVVTVRKKNIVPGLKRPDKEKLCYSWESEFKMITGKDMQLLYEFNEPWEMKPGDWTFQILYRGRVLCSKTFEVYDPDQESVRQQAPASE